MDRELIDKQSPRRYESAKLQSIAKQRHNR
jgi:hypothetical protein